MQNFAARIGWVLCLLAITKTLAAQELLAVPGGQMASVGDVVEIEIRHLRNNQIWLGGAFSVDYGDGLELIDYRYADTSDPQFTGVPVKEPGTLLRASVGAFSGLQDDIAIMRLWFRVLRDGTHPVTPSATGLAGAEWASAIDFGVFVVPTYRQAFVTTPSTDERELVTFEDLNVERPRSALGLTARTTLPIVSSGSAPLAITNLSVVYGGRDDFYVASENCTDAPLAPGELCEAQIEFLNRDPLGGQFRRASLVIDSDATTDSMRKVRLKTEVSVRNLRISQTNFLDVPIGAPGQIYSVFLVNAGETDTTIDALNFGTQLGAATFSIIHDACTGTTLTAGTQCDLDLHVSATKEFTSTERVILLLTRDGNEYPLQFVLRAWPSAPAQQEHVRARFPADGERRTNPAP